MSPASSPGCGSDRAASACTHAAAAAARNGSIPDASIVTIMPASTSPVPAVARRSSPGRRPVPRPSGSATNVVGPFSSTVQSRSAASRRTASKRSAPGAATREQRSTRRRAGSPRSAGCGSSAAALARRRSTPRRRSRRRRRRSAASHRRSRARTDAMVVSDRPRPGPTTERAVPGEVGEHRRRPVDRPDRRLDHLVATWRPPRQAPTARPALPRCAGPPPSTAAPHRASRRCRRRRAPHHPTCGPSCAGGATSPRHRHAAPGDARRRATCRDRCRRPRPRRTGRSGPDQHPRLERLEGDGPLGGEHPSRRVNRHEHRARWGCRRPARARRRADVAARSSRRPRKPVPNAASITRSAGRERPPRTRRRRTCAHVRRGTQPRGGDRAVGTVVAGTDHDVTTRP